MSVSVESQRDLWISIHTPMGYLTSCGFLPLTELELADHWHKLALIENRERDWVMRQIGDAPTRWIHGYRTMDDFELPKIGYMDEAGNYFIDGPIPEVGPYGEGIK